MEKTLRSSLRASVSGLPAAFALTFALGLGLRFLELPNWLTPVLRAGGEPIMGTHDAYGWLAGAKGVGPFAGQPLPLLVRALHALLPASWGGIGFWLPPVMAAFAGLPLVVLAKRWKAALWGPAAGIAGSCAIGYLIRTRVAMLDTDVLSLLGPTLAAVALCLLLDGLLRPWPGQKPGQSEGEETAAWPSSAFWPLVAGLCLWASFSVWFYGSIVSVLAALFGFSALLAAVLARPEGRAQALLAALLPLAAVVCPSQAARAVPPLLCLAFWRVPGLARRPAVLWGAVLAALLAAAFFGGGLVGGIAERVAYWFKPDQVAFPSSGAASLHPPSVLPSIREALKMPFASVLRFVAGDAMLFPFFLAGLVWLIVVRPAALVFLPLLVLGLFSVKLGARFSMFAAPAMGAGLIGLGLLADRFVALPLPRLAFASVGLLAALLPPALFLNRTAPTPVLSRTYAEALIDLGTRTPPTAWLWLWWDFGYATQYYADRFTIADGARHTEEWLYPLAAVHAAPPAKAAALMRFFAGEMASQPIPPEDAARWADDPAFAHLVTPPMKRLLTMDGAKAAKRIEDIGDGAGSETGADAAYPGQYYVVAWDNLRLAGWILRFGNWNVRDGSYRDGRVTRLMGELRVDQARGVAKTAMSGDLPLSSLDVLDGDGVKRAAWPRSSGLHLVINPLGREAYVLDDVAYDSSMVRMLVGNPAEFAEDAPWTRVYRLKPRPGN